MKKRLKKVLSFLLMFFVICYAFNIKADSGWDGSYDSSSSSSSGWSSSSSWDSSSSFDSDYEGEVDPILVFALLALIILIVVVSSSKKSKHVSSSIFDNVSVEKKPIFTLYDDKKIKEILPSFEQEEFLREVFRIYKDIQEAWMEFNYDALRRYTTDELYNSYHAQLTVLSAKKQKNIMRDFELIACEIVDMEHSENSISLKVHMRVECLDYIVDKFERVVRGSKDIIQYDYEMTFIKGLEKENKCPSCGAELDANSNKCPYCRSIIVSNSHDWVLSKKQVINQRKKY